MQPAPGPTTGPAGHPVRRPAGRGRLPAGAGLQSVQGAAGRAPAVRLVFRFAAVGLT